MADIAFVAPLDMIDEFGANEMAQRADDESTTTLTGAELRTTIEDGDRTGWGAALIAQADAAEAKLQRVCDRANAMLSTAVRSGCDLPDATPITIPPDAKYHALRVARYQLYDDGWPANIREDYTDAIAWMRDVTAGKIELDFGFNLPNICDDALANSKTASIIGVESPIFNTDQSWQYGRSA